MDYIDFQVKIGPRVADRQYSVASRSPLAGENKGLFAPPLTDEQLELFVLKVGLARRGVRRIHSPEWGAARDFGEKLFRALFTEDIRAAFLASQNEAVRLGKGVRIQLTLDAPELANYPWEFLYDTAGGQFLSLFESTPILRYVELARPLLPLAVTSPLRILAVASSPKDYEALDMAHEKRNLAQALDPLLQSGLLELDWLAEANLDALREQLLKRAYHIFHFIGHGGFDEQQQDGVLIFENEQGYSNRVSGERLAVVLGNHRTLRLAVLNACEGARTSQQDPFAGTALTLVRTGNLPAVIAMQFEITDNAAIDFASGFYAAIAAGRPVDAAVSQGRQAIFTDENDIEWSTPVLYLRAADGLIFDIDTSNAASNSGKVTVPLPSAPNAKDETRRAPTEAVASAPILAKDQNAATVAPEALTANQAPDGSILNRIERLPLHASFALSGAVLALATALGVSAALAFWYATEGNLTYLLVPTIALAVLTLLIATVGVWRLIKTLSSIVPLLSQSILILELGWLSAFLYGIFAPFGEKIDITPKFVVIAILIGLCTPLALWMSNPKLSLRVLFLISLAWVLGFILEGSGLHASYESQKEALWVGLEPFKAAFGQDPAFVIQACLIGLYYSWIAPLIGILVMRWQLGGPLPKE